MQWELTQQFKEIRIASGRFQAYKYCNDTSKSHILLNNIAISLFGDRYEIWYRFNEIRNIIESEPYICDRMNKHIYCICALGLEEDFVIVREIFFRVLIAHQQVIKKVQLCHPNSLEIIKRTVWAEHGIISEYLRRRKDSQASKWSSNVSKWRPSNVSKWRPNNVSKWL